jgi:DNA-binding XRE family transcriptional regulator
MLVHTRMLHTNIRDRDVQDKVYFSYQNKSYAIPKRVAEKYRISSALVPHKKGRPVASEKIFSEIENKFTKAGVLLKGLRTREGLTQVQFARKIHITQANLSNMENGRRPIGKQIAKRIEKIFKINYRYFLD